MKTELMQTNRIQVLKNAFFFCAYTIWMIRMFVKTTFFYSVPLVQAWNDYALDVVILLCIAAAVLDFELKIKEILLLFAICLFYWIAYATGAGGILGGTILLYAGRKVPYRKIVAYTFVLLGGLLIFTVCSSLLGVIENHMFVQEGGRIRYGVGFLYCSYASHYLLLFFMLYFVVRKRVRIYEVILLIALNIGGYLITDTKTDMISLGLMLIVTAFLRLLRAKKKVLQMLSYVMATIPFFFWGISLYTAKAFNWSSESWVKLDYVLNGRLALGNKALQEYPIRVFGQKIHWIGGSAMVKDPTLIYNYVDNNYLSVTLQMGVLFAFFMCLAYGRAAYVAIRKEQFALAAGLFVFMVVGLVNPEMRNLLYNTFLLVLLKPADQFEGIEKWKPKKEWKMKENG